MNEKKLIKIKKGEAQGGVYIFYALRHTTNAAHTKAGGFCYREKICTYKIHCFVEVSKLGFAIDFFQNYF